MAANGTKAEELLEHVLEEDFILAVEGGVAAIDTFFLTIGAQGESGYEILEKLAAKAKAIFAVGTCSSYGGIQAAYPNPSKTCGISEVLSQKVVNIAGCPPSDINIIATLSFLLYLEFYLNLMSKIVLFGLMVNACMICVKERQNLKVGFLLNILTMRLQRMELVYLR